MAPADPVEWNQLNGAGSMNRAPTFISGGTPYEIAAQTALAMTTRDFHPLPAPLPQGEGILRISGYNNSGVTHYRILIPAGIPAGIIHH
jgi:hypothetical protein